MMRQSEEGGTAEGLPTHGVMLVFFHLVRMNKVRGIIEFYRLGIDSFRGNSLIYISFKNHGLGA
jgi:hypothetical protein